MRLSTLGNDKDVPSYGQVIHNVLGGSQFDPQSHTTAHYVPCHVCALPMHTLDLAATTWFEGSVVVHG